MPGSTRPARLPAAAGARAATAPSSTAPRRRAPAPLGLLRAGARAGRAGQGSPIRTRGEAGSRIPRRSSGCGAGDPAGLAGRVDLHRPAGVTCRRPASTPRAASSTSTTRAGASAATGRSSSGWCGSPPRSRGCASGWLADLGGAELDAASGCWPAPCGCSTSACSGSAASSTPTRTVASAWPRSAKSTSRCATGAVEFDYPAKGGVRRVQTIDDPMSLELVRALRRRRAGATSCWPTESGGRWHRVRSEEINEYLKAELGEDFSAKDFRTWNATVLAAVSLATDGREARPRPPASARSTAPCGAWPSCSATRRRWRGAPTSTRACSTAISRAGRSPGRSSASRSWTAPTTACGRGSRERCSTCSRRTRDSPALERARRPMPA